MNKFLTIMVSTAAVTGLVFSAACSRSSPVNGIDSSNPGSGGAGSSQGSNIFMSILPAGENGNSAGGVGAPAAIPPSATVYPANFNDQLTMYENLAFSKEPLTSTPCNPPTSLSQHVASSDNACNYFKHESLKPDTVVSSVSLTAPNGKKVTIQRDGWGVPYVTGDDRSSAMYGVGYAAAQDRLWLYDLLRNLGRGRVSQFLGPSETTYALDRQYGSQMGYSDDELNAMATSAQAKFGTLGNLAIKDVGLLVQGMNAYVAFLQTPQGAAQIPPEYATLAASAPLKFPTAPFTVADIVVNASLIQAIFGGGGGNEVSNVKLLQSLDSTIGPATTQIPQTACEEWRDLRHANDPESPATTELSFATQSPANVSETCPQALPTGTAIWDQGSFKALPFLTNTPIVSVPGVTASATSKIPKLVLAALRLKHKGLTSQQAMYTVRKALQGLSTPHLHELSNWIGVNANQTKDGHPIVVMGPQTSYYEPQLLSEMAVVSKGGTPLDFATRGIMTLNLPYVVIGRGSHYAWSATSGESDLIDTRVSYLCNMDGSTPAGGIGSDGFLNADGYMFDLKDGNGPQCRHFYKRLDSWTATPTPASIALDCTSNPAASTCHKTPETVNRYILRTHYGLVYATATVKGKPVAISQQRSTFFGELDTVPPFTLVGTHIPMSATTFYKLFNSMTSTFNWLYTDEKDLGYIHSGLYPQRSAQAHPELPTWGDGNYEWQSDVNFFKSHPNYFAGPTATQSSFGSRSVPVAQGDPMNGYFEWTGFLSLSAHPQDTNPSKGYLTSWNNRPARDWWAADGNGTYGPIHRVDMLRKRLVAFQSSGKKHDIGSMVEIMADAAYTDLRAQELIPLLVQLMQSGTLTADQLQVMTLMQTWVNQTSSANWIGPSAQNLGGWRRDRSNTRDSRGNIIYDNRAQVVLMDAWYPFLIQTMLPQMVSWSRNGSVSLLMAQLDAPRAQGSAFQEGWFEQMKRVLETVLNVPGHVDYRQIKCADGTQSGCRQAVLNALASALNQLGGLSNMANWDGTQLVSAQYGATGHTVEDYDMIRATDFSLLPIAPIEWENRPTFQQAVQVYNSGDGN